VIPPSLQQVVIVTLGFCNILFAVRLFWKGADILVTVLAVAAGAVLGTVLGLSQGLAAFAEWAHHITGGGGRFTEAVVTTFVLYCVGPMTLLGCIKDGLEGDIELLKLKSTMDGLTAIFFAAALGPGVLVTAGVILVFQGALTLLARPLEPLTRIPNLMDEATAVGGVIILSIGLGLAGIKRFPSEVMLPSLVLAPLFVWGKSKFSRLSNPEPD
jgi:uncharacterized membrane protein YqgA involved in biofilm formation